MDTGAWGPVQPGECYPLSLAEELVPVEVLELYGRWLSFLGRRFEPREDPWIPVGCAGPLLILGHHAPYRVEPFLPFPCCQPVHVSLDDYERHLALCSPVLGDLVEQYSETHDWAERGLPERFIMPCSLRAALQFLVEYYPKDGSEAMLLRELVQRQGLDPAMLPPGYFAACQLLSRQGMIVDPRSFRGTPASQFPTALSLPKSCSVVACKASTLWVASPRLAMPELEDALLNDLGEGWSIRFLLKTESAPESAENGGQGVRRARVRLSPSAQTAASRGRDFKRQGEILLGTSDIAELERYDPRRGEPDALKVFLKELSAAIKVGASDLHLEPGLEGFRIRARVDGLLEEWFESSVDFGLSVVGAAKELLSMPAERFLPQDASCVVRHGGDSINVRISTFPLRKRCQKLVVRILPKRGDVPALDRILSPREARILLRAARAPQGLILLCGPTGSGKTTTVFSALNAINSAERNITSLEDPVEYELEGVNQAELDSYRGVGWDQLLKGFLRQDPDAGMLGEIRDAGTAETAVRQSLTGHIVFATLHTMSCSQTLARLLDMGVKPDLLATALSLVVSQRLVRRLCPSCKVARPCNSSEDKLFRTHRIPVPESLCDARQGGCPECRNGYRGRLAAVELLPVTEEVSHLVEARSGQRVFEQWMRDHGFPSVFESALLHVAAGETSLDEACEWQSVWENYDFSS